MKKIMSMLFMLCFVSAAHAQITSYNWPVGNGQALLSDKYRVFVKLGSSPEQEVQVLKSEVTELDFMGTENTGRSFSFASIAYNPEGGNLSVRVEKMFGSAAVEAKLSPRSYGLAPVLDASGKELNFTLNQNNRYISVNFSAADNKTAKESWIKHMLMIYVDPPESAAPAKTDAGVVVYSSSTAADTIANAQTIYFPAGHHNLQEYQFKGSTNGNISSTGKLTLKNNQHVYVEGGALVEGYIQNGTLAKGNKITGRGILTGRKYSWADNKAGNNDVDALIKLWDNCVINGLIYVDAPNHGLVAGNNTIIDNIKMLGWHGNNDGVRVGQRSVIKNSFMRSVDDHFYNFNVTVKDSVLWAGHNGAILTYGWGGDTPTANTYNSGASLIENVDIINPEWVGLGNNQGIVASQTGLDYKPFNYGTASTLTILRNVRIEGNITGLLNLKPRSQNDGVPLGLQVPLAKVGYLGDLLLENVTVDGMRPGFKSRIRGALNAASDASNITYYAKNIQFKNVKIGNTCISDANKATYIDIEAATTQAITFECSGASSSSSSMSSVSSSSSISSSSSVSSSSSSVSSVSSLASSSASSASSSLVVASSAQSSSIATSGASSKSGGGAFNLLGLLLLMGIVGLRTKTK